VKKIFYKPQNGWVGDVIPYYKNGEFKLFYLYDQRKEGSYGDYTCWNLVTTKDFVNFKELGTVLPNGTDEEQDRNVYTGCIIQDRTGLYHIFYTGHNPNEKFCKDNTPLQAVMHATGNDMLHWVKHTEDMFYADGVLYEKYDWRDPFVFYNEEDNKYWMLITSRRTYKSPRRGGCIALCKSVDLHKWEYCEPFFEPNLYVTIECPDLFKIGKWWYLVYSTFSDRFATHYRMSKSLNGPWYAPFQDTFDGRGFYAAKTFSDGVKRYAFGWVPSKKKAGDCSDCDWGGTLVIHEIVQNSDGKLYVKMPDTILNAFKHEIHLNIAGRLGFTDLQEDNIYISNKQSIGYIIYDDVRRHQYLIKAKIRFRENTRNFGIALMTDNTLDNGVFFRLEPFHQRLVKDMWPRCESGIFQWQIGGDKPFAVELERPIKLIPDQDIDIKLLFEDDICVIYVNEQTALTTRIYNFKKGKWGFFVSAGSIDIKDVRCHVII